MTIAANKSHLSVVIAAGTRASLETAAEKDRRSLSNLVDCVLSDYVAGKLVPARSEAA